MQRTWKRIEATMQQRWPDGHASLNPGADAARIAALQARIGAELPDDLVQSLSRHDGQCEGELWDMWGLLSVRGIEAQWSLMQELLEAGELDGFTTRHDKRIKPGWWRAGWIPVCADGCGDLLCVDLDPGPKGARGQVVWFRHDDAERSVEARSFKAWMQRAARELPKVEREQRVGPVTVGRGASRRTYRDVRPAFREVLKGEWKRGKQALTAFAAQGDQGAAAALGYVAAYEGDWPAVLDAAERVVGDTEAFPAANVHTDYAALAARAGAETGAWERVARVAAALARVGPGLLAARLTACAEEAADSYNRSPALSEGDEARLAQGWADYVAGGDARRPKYVQKTAERRLAHDFSVAGAMQQWAVLLEQMQAHPELPAHTGSAGFEWVVAALRWALTRPRPLAQARAWKLLFDRLDRWMPVFECQLLPVSPVTAEGVRDLLTPARRRKILAAPKARWTWDPRAETT